eukprot:2680150-Alexandrium_andersonii.AAC.1
MHPSDALGISAEAASWSAVLLKLRTPPVMSHCPGPECSTAIGLPDGRRNSSHGEETQLRERVGSTIPFLL